MRIFDAYAYGYIVIQVIPTDKTGDFDMIYDFLKENWSIARWVALGAVALEVIIFMRVQIL